jgi:hypothetical protein
VNREPDWEALSQLNFLLAPRISGALNEALNALSLAEIAADGINPQLWRDRAKAIIANLLNLYQAWTALIQYKNGLRLPPTAIRPFSVQSLLDWLTIQLELLPPAKAERDLTLNGNQACIQEALWLLYTASYTQGNGVHLVAEAAENGYWFRIRFSRRKPMPPTMESLIETLGSHWRNQDTAFELRVARDFIEMNDGKLELRWHERTQMGEFAFFIYKVGADRAQTPGIAITPNIEHARLVANVTRSMMPASSRGESTRILSSEPESAVESETPERATPVAVLTPTVIEPEKPEATPSSVHQATSQEADIPHPVEQQEGQESGRKEPVPADASEAKSQENERSRGAKLLNTLIELDQQHHGIVESEEDVPTMSLDVRILQEDPEQDRPTQIGQPLIISVNLPEPQMPTLLQTVSSATSQPNQHSEEKSS